MTTTTIGYLFTLYNMDKNPITKGVVPENRAEIEAATREDGSPADYEQASRKLTGQSDLDRQEAVLDEGHGTEQSDSTPDQTGRQIPESISDDEDEEGRSQSEQLAEMGVSQAERDQILQAAIETAKKDKSDQP